MVGCRGEVGESCPPVPQHKQHACATGALMCGTVCFETRDCINGSPLTTGTSHWLPDFQLVARLSYWKCVVTFMFSGPSNFDLGYLFFGANNPGGLPGPNS